MNEPVAENLTDTVSNKEVVTSTNENKQVLSPERAEELETEAMKQMVLLSAEMKDWLEEVFQVQTADAAAIKEKINIMEPRNIQSKLFDFDKQVHIISRMMDLGTYDAKAQQDLVDRWQAVTGSSSRMEAVTLPETVSKDELKQLIKKFVETIESRSGLAAIGHSFKSQYEKRDGEVVEISWLQRLRTAFGGDFKEQDIRNAKQNFEMQKNDATELFNEEIVPTLQGLYQILTEFNLDNRE